MTERITGQTDRQTDRSRFFISKDFGLEFKNGSFVLNHLFIIFR